MFNLFHATGLSIPPENIRKPEVALCFQGGKKETSGMKWVKGKNYLALTLNYYRDRLLISLLILSEF